MVNYANKKKRFRVGSLGLCITSYIVYSSSAMTMFPHIDNVRCITVQNSKISFLLEYTFDGAGATESVF